MERLFIADKKEFAESKKWVDHVFNTEQELPEKVFQNRSTGSSLKNLIGRWVKRFGLSFRICAENPKILIV